ncbi:MAG: UDP-N-acetylglucosamine 2-epimerase (non-hydrolyzing) [Candidatus Aminicenantes bacterium]|nr:UDP-N-acetylglucosamine 2-epimerase (non-hydrolyzing) [Candidatus Aminicenantes bacterium]
MKIMSIVGTRPEIIRLSLIIKLLDQYAQHVFVHTGQNYDDRLSALFFRELQVREPDVYMGVRGRGFADQVGQILAGCEPLFLEHKPDRLLVLGDTNSGLTALIARRLGIPVYHMEAGNRCYDDRVPEEVNRRVIDHSSSVLMPYTNRSKENLIREGIAGDRIYVTGNPIKEVIDYFSTNISSSTMLEEHEVEKGKYFLVTMHRAENVDIEERLRKLVEALEMLNKEYGYPVICSFHPRTREKVQRFGVDIKHKGLKFVEPLGFFDFVNLEKSAFCILSDSGTVQEEACILGIPNVTIRDVTERPETIECGSNILSGCDPKTILNLVNLVVAQKGLWVPPAEYLADNVSWTAARIMLGYRLPDLAEQEWRRKQ